MGSQKPNELTKFSVPAKDKVAELFHPTLFENAEYYEPSFQDAEQIIQKKLRSGPWTVTKYDSLTINDCAEILSSEALTLLRAEEGLEPCEVGTPLISQMTELLLAKEARTLEDRKLEIQGKFECGTKDNSNVPDGGTYEKIDDSHKNREDDATAVVVGGFLDDQKIYFWANDSIIKFYIKGSSFPSQRRFSIVEKAFSIVALAWTRIAPGSTSFVRVYSEKESDYVMQYVSKDSGFGTLASASPPAFYTLGEHDISVYPTAFDSDFVGIMSNILAHEFGHVVGLRHSFAQQREATYESASYFDDPTSVMSYNFPPIINVNDVKNTRDIYTICQDGSRYYFPFQNKMLLFTTVRIKP